MSISKETVVARNEEKFLSSDLGDELVMMDLENGNYIGLNEVGSDIWQLLETPIKIADVVGKLVEDYDVEKEECEQDVLMYLNEMLKRGLVDVKG